MIAFSDEKFFRIRNSWAISIHVDMIRARSWPRNENKTPKLVHIERIRPTDLSGKVSTELETQFGMDALRFVWIRFALPEGKAPSKGTPRTLGEARRHTRRAYACDWVLTCGRNFGSINMLEMTRNETALNCVTVATTVFASFLSRRDHVAPKH